MKALIYSDIFDFPLTKKEIWKFWIGKKVSKKCFDRELKSLSGVGFKHNFHYLLGREEIVERRIERKKESRKKLELAKKIIKYLSIVPTVSLIGISGGLALENAEKEDDIDIFVITSKGSLWITRLILVFLLIIMGQYRGRDKKVSQKVCLNMLIDENALEFEKGKQNLYTAHEALQLLPIFERNNMYRKFIEANQKWIVKFLPNSVGHESAREIRKRQNSFFIISCLLSILEQIAKAVQMRYMKRHITKETIENDFLAFHPFDYSKHVSREYNKRLKQYEI